MSKAGVIKGAGVALSVFPDVFPILQTQNTAEGTAMVHVKGIAPQPLARVSTVASLLLNIAGAVDFAVADLANHAHLFILLLVFAFTSPAWLLFFLSGLRIRSAHFHQAAVASFVGGLITLADFIAAYVWSVFANPCFTIPACTRGPSFSYVAFTVAAIVFLVTAVLGLFASPIAIRGAAHFGHR